jgi:hypothetical protein
MRRTERDPDPPRDLMTVWRAGCLRRSRFSLPLAEILARDRDDHLRAMPELTARRCPPELTARSLGPVSSTARRHGETAVACWRSRLARGWR